MFFIIEFLCIVEVFYVKGIMYGDLKVDNCFLCFFGDEILLLMKY